MILKDSYDIMRPEFSKMSFIFYYKGDELFKFIHKCLLHISPKASAFDEYPLIEFIKGG